MKPIRNRPELPALFCDDYLSNRHDASRCCGGEKRRRILLPDFEFQLSVEQPDCPMCAIKIRPASVLSSYFPAQNCEHHACGLNRSFCGKLQARTDLKLTVAAAVDSFV